MILNRRFFYLIATISLLISIGTWISDIVGMVSPCIYCRNERTVIGLLGIILLLPAVRYLSVYLAAVLGFFGAFVASEQIFLAIKNATFDYSFMLALAALFIIIAQVFIIRYRDMIIT